MPAAARLATIRLLVEREPVIAAPISSDGSTSQSRRVIRTTSTRRRNPLLGIPAIAEVPTVASLVHGLQQTAAPAGLIWKALKAVRSMTAASIIHKTGTIRASLLTQMTPTASSSTHMTFGSQRAPELCGTISRVAILAGTRGPCTWTNMHSRSYLGLPAFWYSAMMAGSTGRRTQTLRARRWIRPGSTWIPVSTQSSFTPVISAATSRTLPLRRQMAARRTTALAQSPLPARQRGPCYGSWASSATDFSRALIP